MGILSIERWEILAQGVARGLPMRTAGDEAGYSSKSRGIYRIAKKQPFIERVAEIAHAAKWGGTADLSPVIDALARLAEAAAEQGTAAGMKTALEMFREVAELKRQPRLDNLSVSAKPRSVTLSPEEWSRQFSPRG